MTDVIVFHHALGLTAGVREFADQLSSAGHQVTVPDLYDGATFASIAEGIAHAEQIGFQTILDRGRAAAEGLPAQIVYLGFSLGVMPAQLLAQTRPGAKGAVLVSACVDPAEFGGEWPVDVPVQIHAMDGDQMLVEDGDLDVARQLANTVDAAELFLYPGDRHLFADRSFSEYDGASATSMTQRVLSFLG